MYPMLGPANAALVSFYFASVWGREALKALISPYSGFEAPSHAAVVGLVRQLFELNLTGLMRTSAVLAGI